MGGYLELIMRRLPTTVNKANRLSSYLVLSFGLLAFVFSCKVADQNSGEKPKWRYSENPDKMGRGVIKSASIISLNTVSFQSPYDGEQHGKLYLRKHPQSGDAAMFSIERGQFLTGIHKLQLLIRFDDKKPMSFYANEPESGNSDTVFIEDYFKFETSLKASKKVIIEAPFYLEGKQIFEFDVEGLVWENPPYVMPPFIPEK